MSPSGLGFNDGAAGPGPSMSRRRLVTRACMAERRRGAAGRDLQGPAGELAVASPFLSPRERTRWRCRIGTWQRGAVQDAALLTRLDGILARDTASGTAVPTRRSA